MATTEANTELKEKKLSFKLDNEDAILWLKRQKDSSIDLLITDPPYESLEKHRKIGTTTRLKNSKSSSIRRQLAWPVHDN